MKKPKVKKTAELYEFRFPDIGEGIHEGQVLEWKHAPGDHVAEGEILALVETDKVVAEIPSPKDGILRERGAETGQTIQVGQVLARIETGAGAGDGGEHLAQDVLEGGVAAPWPGADRGSVVGRLDSGSEAVLPPSREAPAPAWEAPSPPAGNAKVLASPAARKLAATLGIELTDLAGTGPAGRVLKEDILRSAAVGLQRLSTLRRSLARNMERSWQIPAAVVHEQTVVDDLVALRHSLNQDAAGEDSPALSYLSFFLKVAALALRRYPLLNSLYYPEQDAFETPGEINIGFALDSEAGLVVPVIRRVDTLTLGEIQEQINRRRAEAAQRTLDLAALRDGTFTVSNYGSIGGLHGRPLILPPQVAILGIGRIHAAPAVRDGVVVAAQQLPLSLVFDHRLVDGAYAAGFLRLLMSLLSAPHRLIAALR